LEVLEFREAVQLARVAKIAERAGAGHVVHRQIRVAAKRIHRAEQNGACLRGALLRHQYFSALFLRGRPCGAHRDSARREYSSQQAANGYPHSTDPPFTLITSPVIKDARSDAAKRIGPAISSAVA